MELNAEDKQSVKHWCSVTWVVLIVFMILPIIGKFILIGFNWDIKDFLIFELLLTLVGMVLDGIVRKHTYNTYRIAFYIVIISIFLMIWINLGIGVIGNDGDSINLALFVIIPVGVYGSFRVNFHPVAMSFLMLSIAFLIGLITVYGVYYNLKNGLISPYKVIIINGVFILSFIVSAVLFFVSDIQMKRNIISLIENIWSF